MVAMSRRGEDNSAEYNNKLQVALSVSPITYLTSLCALRSILDLAGIVRYIAQSRFRGEKTETVSFVPPKT